MKKVLIVFILFAYMNCYMGCTSINRVKTNTYEQFDKSNIFEPIIVMTNDSTEYYFKPLDYSFTNDRIMGTAKMIEMSEYKWVSLASSDILSIDTVEAEKRHTFVGDMLTVLLIVGFIFLIKAGFDYMDGGIVELF